MIELEKIEHNWRLELNGYRYFVTRTVHGDGKPRWHVTSTEKTVEVVAGKGRTALEPTALSQDSAAFPEVVRLINKNIKEARLSIRPFDAREMGHNW